MSNILKYISDFRLGFFLEGGGLFYCLYLLLFVSFDIMLFEA